MADQNVDCDTVRAWIAPKYAPGGTKAGGSAGHALAVVEVPLLFESGYDYGFDAIAVTWVDEAIQRQRALADVRAQVADLALLAAGRVVGETMSDARQRRLVDDFLAEVTAERGGRGKA